MKQLNELVSVSNRMGKLLNIEAYDTLDYALELNVEILIKAKEYFLQHLLWHGVRLSELEKQLEYLHSFYKMKYSEAVVKYCSMEDPDTKKKYTMGKAEHKANFDVEYVGAKEQYAETVGDKELIKNTYYVLRERISAIAQQISLLRKENDFTQFTKDGGETKNI
jgi:hypothetical protein